MTKCIRQTAFIRMRIVSTALMQWLINTLAERSLQFGVNHL
ncbi:hypothetical protein [Oculatella sp. LEGE 06141]|nr:hypothetical protein [Oculatella sp. LEGE 06141]